MAHSYSDTDFSFTRLTLHCSSWCRPFRGCRHRRGAAHPETALLDALKLVASRRVSELPMANEHGTPVGMMSKGDVPSSHEWFSEREAWWFDLLAQVFELAPDFLPEPQEQHPKIKAIMSSNPITVSETAPARGIASLMYAHGIKRVPVTNDGKLVGIVNRAGLVRELSQILS